MRLKEREDQAGKAGSRLRGESLPQELQGKPWISSRGGMLWSECVPPKACCCKLDSPEQHCERCPLGGV